MKRIKSNHLWRRGATLLLAMLMLFTCVGSALPAFAEEAAGNTATVDSGDPVLADSSASGDSTGDTGTDLPDDPQRPTLPSGEDISEEAPPADESDGETVPPADSDSSEDPAAPDSGDSIPDESESEPAEQPGEGDADLPEDEQPSGEEPDPDEDEEIPENEPEDEPFEALVILDPENGAAVQAGVGEEVTFKAPVSREDVAVAYQWQRFQKPAAGSVQTEALYDYAEGETTEYWYALDDMREAEALAMNPDMLWPGIEMYYATVAALDEIGADSSDVSIAWKTPNFALEGYTISAAETESGIEVYADKDDERHVAHLNENSEWEFGEAEEKPETTGAWLNIEGANGPEYAFTVEERDYDASFRCEVTVLDEVYLEQCLSILEEQGIELTEEQRAAEQKLYSVVMSVENGKEEALPEDEPMTFSMARSMLRAAASGKPQLSADAQWIEGLDGNYQYITKDTYDRVSEWLAKGEITETQAARYWTYLRPNGYTGSTVANVLDENGKPTGTTRQYQGFDLTDGMLEVNSEWYGKTVYFRVAGSGGTGTAITIPAYTELETDENGNYIEGASGTKYKNEIKRGEIYYITFAPVVGSEQHGGRPGIVVSNNMNNAHSNTIEVVYLTTQPKKMLPTHTTITATGRDSVALCEQINTVDKSRVGLYIGELSAREMAAVEEAITASLALRIENARPKIPYACMACKNMGDIEETINRASVSAQRDAYKAICETLIETINNKN